MNDEVKEILDGMKKANNENCNLWLENVSIKLLYNYITNLQNELKYQKEMEDEYIEKHTKLLQDFTNLQKENENLEKLNNANYLSFIDVNKKRLKAIEFIKENAGYYDEEIRSCSCDLLYSDCDKLIELLGGDNE